MLAHLWPCDAHGFRRLVHDLSYQAHGGTGLAHGYRDILEMDVRDAYRFVEQLEAAREATAKAITDAAKASATR